MSIEPCVRIGAVDGAWLPSASTRAADTPGKEPRRWLPGGLPTAGEREAIDLATPPLGELPALLFDEADMARLAAAVEMDARERARAEWASTGEMQRTRAVGRAADALAAAFAVHRADEAASLGHIVELSEAMAQAMSADSRTPAALGVLIQSMLAMAATAPSVRVVTCPDDEAAVSALLPEVVAASGFTGGVEIVVEPRLPSGAVQLVWVDGWLEHAPAAIRHRIDAVLAHHRSGSRMSAPPSVTALGSTPSCVTTTGDDDASD